MANKLSLKLMGYKRCAWFGTCLCLLGCLLVHCSGYRLSLKQMSDKRCMWVAHALVHVVALFDLSGCKYTRVAVDFCLLCF